MKNKKTILMISCLVGLISAVGYMSRMQSIRKDIVSHMEMTPVLTVSKTVFAGDRLLTSNLKTIAIPRQSHPRRALSPDDASLIENRRVLHTIPAGDPIFWTDLPEGPRVINPSEKIPAGLRAFALPADETHTMVHFLSPGDRVDILASSFSQSTGELVTALMGREIKVLSVGNNMDGMNQNPDEPAYPLSVTLIAEPDTATEILRASQIGEIHFLVRSRDIFSEIFRSNASSKDGYAGADQ